MNTLNITQKNITKVPDGKYRISENLYLVVRREGRSRAFVFRYRSPLGVRKDLSLGSATVTTLASAKEEAMKCQVLLARGIDPYQARQERKEQIKEQEQKKKQEKTFSDFVEYGLQELFIVKNVRESTKRQYGFIVEKHLKPTFGDMKFSEMTPKAISDRIRVQYIENPSYVRGHIVLFKCILGIAVRDGLLSHNPAVWDGALNTYLSPFKRDEYTKHHCSANIIETKRLIRLCLQEHTPNTLSIVFVILTASRVSEVFNLEWSFLDIQKAVMAVPPKYRKDRAAEDHRVPLSKQALEILDFVSDKEGVVFKSVRKRGKILETVLLRNIRRLLPNSTMTLHGFRSTFRDWAAENGIDPILAEKSLMHSTGNAVQKAYQRSDLLEQRRPVMQKWADALISVEEVKKLLAE